VPELFRAEALAESQTQWLGSVLLTPKLSHRLFAFAGGAAAAAIVALLFMADYTRTARVNGWLVPHEGVVRVVAPRVGVVTALHVAEGMPVRKGQPLLTLSDELQSAALGATQAAVGREIAQRHASLQDELQQQQQLLQQQRQALADRVEAMQAEQAQIEREIKLFAARVAIAERNEKLHREQFKVGYISEMRLQLVQSERLEQVARLGALQRSRLTLSRELISAAAELQDLPLKFGKEIATVERNLAQLAQERAEAEAKREIVVPAPGDGTVTAVEAVLGAGVGTTLPLLSIVPAQARLEAHLYGPSRAVGFVRPGQRVLLRYRSYPYQRFGHHKGTVASISRSAVSPGDLPAQLAGLGALTGTAGSAAEPIYRIVVALASQSIQAYGEPLTLQSGMTLEADISLERRRLAEWVLDPLQAITGKWQP
jgi:membrane fusion protein